MFAATFSALSLFADMRNSRMLSGAMDYNADMAAMFVLSGTYREDISVWTAIGNPGCAAEYQR